MQEENEAVWGRERGREDRQEGARQSKTRVGVGRAATRPANNLSSPRKSARHFPAQAPAATIVALGESGG